MGFNLVLLFAKGKIDNIFFCCDCLTFDQDYKIFGQLNSVFTDAGKKPTIKPQRLLPEMWVEIYDGEAVKNIREDKYGETLAFVYAHELTKIELSKETSQKNRAIQAYINALPKETIVILYWI